MEILVSFFIIVFGILQIILFFKIWEMTNNVKDLKVHFCDCEQQKEKKVTQTKEEQINNGNKYDKRLDTIKPGDKVALPNGDELVVDTIDKDRFFCKTGTLSGYKYFKKSEVIFIDKK